MFQLYGDVVFENVAKVRELQVNCIRDFNETASDIFDDILGKEIYIQQCFCFVLSLQTSLILGGEDLNVKNNDASDMIRDQGNKVYQKKQFKVIKRSHFKIKAR